MGNHIQLDEGLSGKYTETEEVSANIHRQGVSVRDVKACRLVRGGTVTQSITCISANTDYAITTALAGGSKYLVLYCASPFVAAMGAATSTTVGVHLAAGTWTFPVTYTGVAADDRLHVQSATAGAVVWATEMAD